MPGASRPRILQDWARAGRAGPGCGPGMRRRGGRSLRLNLCKRISGFKILQGALETIVLNLCNNNQSTLLVSLSDVADTENNEIKRIIIDILVKVLHHLCIENYLQFESIVLQFPNDPGETDLHVLIKLSEKLYTSGNIDGFNLAIKIAKEEALHTKNINVLSDLQLYESRLHMLQGRYNEARVLLETVIEQKVILSDSHGLCMAIRKLGVLDWREGKIEQSLERFESALAISRESNFDDLFSPLLNNIGVINLKIGSYEKAKQLFNESLELKNKQGVKKGIGVTLNNLGVLNFKLGNLVMAERYFNDSLKIRSEIGDQKGLSSVLNNIGLFYMKESNYFQSERHINESYRIRNVIQDKKGICMTLNNLGILKFKSNKEIEAKKFYFESLDVAVNLGDNNAVQIALHNLNILLMKSTIICEKERDKIESARNNFGINSFLENDVRTNECIEYQEISLE
jgi:tetratricopeptide (TPR) repeat protein